MANGKTVEGWKGVTWKPLKAVIIDPDADGVFAYLMAGLCDPEEKIFPGLKQAPIVIEPNEALIEERYGAMLDNLEAVAFDTSGRRPFDHHPPEDYPGECAIKNVAVVTGMYDRDPVITAMADQATQWDNKGGGDIFATINRRFKRFRNDPRWRDDEGYRQTSIHGALILAQELFDDWWYWQAQMKDPTIRQAIERGTIESQRSSLRGCVVIHDNLWTRDVAQKDGYALIAQLTSYGEGWVRPNRRIVQEDAARRMVLDVLRIIRADIGRPRGFLYDDDQLIAPGKIEGSEEVYFHQQGLEIFVGGNVRKSSPTPDWDPEYYERVLRIALTLALDPGRFPLNCPFHSTGYGCQGPECGIYLANLPRCGPQGRV